MNNFYYFSLSISGLVGAFFLRQTIVCLVVFFANRGLGHYSSFSDSMLPLFGTAAFGGIVAAAFYAREYAENLKMAIAILSIPYIIALLFGAFWLFILTNGPIRWN